MGGYSSEPLRAEGLTNRLNTEVVSQPRSTDVSTGRSKSNIRRARLPSPRQFSNRDRFDRLVSDGCTKTCLLHGVLLLTTTTKGDFTGLTAAGGEAVFPCLGTAGRSERNHTRRQPMPPKSGSLTLYDGGPTRAHLIQTHRQNTDGTRSRKCSSPGFRGFIETDTGASRSSVHRIDGRNKNTSQEHI